MAYQYVREPLRFEESDRLCQACETVQEKLIVWTLLDTGLRVSELCGLTTEQILWQQKAIRVSGKGGPYGKKSKKEWYLCLSAFKHCLNIISLLIIPGLLE